MAVEAGVRELRSNLRSYLDRVRAGDDVIVTEHGRPIARIVPLEGGTTFERLVAEGRITRARRRKSSINAEELPRVRGGTVADILVAQRRAGS